MKDKFKILLYYKYVKLTDVEQIQKEHLEFCKANNIKGRVILANEGINGTVAGLPTDVKKYQKFLKSYKEFADIEFKESFEKEQVFPRISVKIRDEIVTLGLKAEGKDASIKNKAKYIEPKELLDLYEKKKDFVIIDARNKYEADVGKFKNAIVPPIDAFKEFPNWIKKQKHLKDKKVVTYCTGGVRCEKASAFLKEEGFKDVSQLHGGVDVYAKKTGGKNFEGELFVFDKRLHLKVNKVNPKVVSKCKFCSKKVTRLVDCAQDSCGKLFIACKTCEQKHLAACSFKCKVAVYIQKITKPLQQLFITT